ncbi:hypothetical protein OIU76_019698 [Salix suchowensis]|uniref:Glutaredoxin domain-containing protein n=1 Tax=Salix suchowensis TaxID=1278906 RepID=A0ABQ8ZJK7_9ROSI|nr:hypothetical protein OIU76_019698 [Salix suchowensis]KAJ6302011.1 hypothetical protein OIU77_016171 [Salix suchowensis]
MAMNKAKELVSTNSVVVFSKTFCPYCTKVKQLSESIRSQIHCCGIGYREGRKRNPISVACVDWTTHGAKCFHRREPHWGL